MNIVAWMVIKDDAYYADMAVKGVLPYVSGIYVQDQASTDNSVQVIKDTVDDKVPLIIEIEDTGLKRFDPEYNETVYRSLAIKRARKLFSSDWLLQFDADDYYTPYFFGKLVELEESGKLDRYNSVRQAAERFVTPEYRARAADNELGSVFVVNGEAYLDPHTRLWRSNLPCEYIQNPEFVGSEYQYLHCILHPEPVPTYWLPGMCVIHLHRIFGPKAWSFWAESGDVFERTIPFNPRRQAPKHFESDKAMGNAVYMPYDWPDFILKKWKEWAIYD